MQASSTLTRSGADPHALAHPFEFIIDAEDAETGARTGRLWTPRGVVPTPMFMPVGTQASVKTLSNEDLEAAGARILLANAYHLYLRPGPDLIEEAGGLGGFSAWRGPYLTDSGGYQVLSLADRATITDEGVTFRSHLDGTTHLFTPESVIEIERALGADIIMAFDQPEAYPTTWARAEASTSRTIGWAERAVRHFERTRPPGGVPQALFGIVQGSVYPDLRRRSALSLAAMGFPGYAIGGCAIGEPKGAMWDVLDATLPHLPSDRPRYLMGVGYPEDLIAAVARGVDLFDCVIPTRNGRNGSAYTHGGRIIVKNAGAARNFESLDPACECPACEGYTQAYLRHLFGAGEVLGPRLVSLHNIWFFMDLMAQMRAAITDGSFGAWRSEFLARYGRSSGEARHQEGAWG